jgi:hypothetical protein
MLQVDRTALPCDLQLSSVRLVMCKSNKERIEACAIGNMRSDVPEQQ